MEGEYQAVAEAADIPEDEGIQVQVGGAILAIFNHGGRFYATDDTCTHAQASLADGYLEDGCIECPLHEGRFELATGRAVSPPVTEDLNTYPLKVEAGKIYVKIPGVTA